MTRDDSPVGPREPTREPAGSAAVDGGAQSIGNYRLVEKIGDGGMGEVWAADQVSPIRRRVALKIIKRGMDTEEFIARFESERQALAMMDHPAIARVYDAGVTGRGRPYLVMEYVPGVPVTQYCNDHRLDLRARLELFIRVCEGIQHAHQKAIIHRDIKPSNVLVAERDDAAWPKVIDFGIAKALGHKLTETTIQTAMGQILGTPEFMSPEQADLAEAAIDTRTDIYLLGVLLYVMLTDVLPFDPEQMRAVGLQGMLHRIRTVDPPRPSVRVAELGAAAEPVATARGLTPAKLVERLRGDLDWITMMALEKEQDKRYPTVQALIADISHHLRDEPVAAGAPSTAYRVQKFVKRHRPQVLAASLVLVAIVLGILGTTTGMIQARRAERVATAEARAAKEVADFMVGMFSVTDPSEARGNSISAREILDRGVASIEGGLQAQPLTRARLMNTMGRVYRELGLYQAARPLLERSLSLLGESPSAKPLDGATFRNDLGTLLWKTGDYEEARANLESALAVREQQSGPQSPELAESLNSLGNLEWVTGHPDQAKSCYERALAIREVALGPDSPDVAITLNNLGGLSLNAGEFPAARTYLERALAIRERSLGADHPDVANSLSNLGNLAAATGDLHGARGYFERALAIRRKVLGPDHPQVAATLKELAGPLEDLGDRAAARDAYEQALAIQVAAMGPNSPDVANTLTNYGVLLRNFGDPDSAEKRFTRALGIWETAAGPGSVMAAACHSNLAVVSMDRGDFAGAKARLEKALAIQRSVYGADHLEIARTLKNLGDARLNLGDQAGARADYEQSLAMTERIAGPSHRDVATALQGYGQLLTQLGDLAAAKPVLERAVAIREAAFGTNHLDYASSLSDLALLQYYEGDHEKARAGYRRALEIQQRQLPADNPQLLGNLYNMACLAALGGDRAGALVYLRQAVEGGFVNAAIDDDPDLSTLHGDPAYEALAARARAGAGGIG